MTVLHPATSSNTGMPTDVPTVAKLARAKRCSATVQVDVRRRRRCRTHSDTALNGQVLCLQHLGEALWADGRHPETGEGHVRPPHALTAACLRRGDVLREVLDHLRAGLPDPATNGEQLLAVVPAGLVERIEDTLARPLC